MPETRGAPLLAIIFWIVACCSLLIVLIPAAEEWRHPGGEFSGLVVIMFAALAVLMALIALAVALIRKPLAYAVGLALLSARC